MYLFSRFIPASPSCKYNNQSQPLLVFLHGLLGSGNDWQACLAACQHLPELNSCSKLLIDLPGHGSSVSIDAHDFTYTLQLIVATITHQQTLNQEQAIGKVKEDHSQIEKAPPIIIIGYSLGARLAMFGLAYNFFESLNVQQVVIEGGHLGLTDKTQRLQRWRNDQHWAQRFSHEPIATVLQDWYQQEVFSSLTPLQRESLICQRSSNIGKEVAQMLLATSLARQPFLGDNLLKDQQKSAQMLYLCGAKDEKFRLMIEQIASVSNYLRYQLIDDAGHNIHQEQPQRFAMAINQTISAILRF